MLFPPFLFLERCCFLPFLLADSAPSLAPWTLPFSFSLGRCRVSYFIFVFVCFFRVIFLSVFLFCFYSSFFVFFIFTFHLSLFVLSFFFSFFISIYLHFHCRYYFHVSYFFPLESWKHSRRIYPEGRGHEVTLIWPFAQRPVHRGPKIEFFAKENRHFYSGNCSTIFFVFWRPKKFQKAKEKKQRKRKNKHQKRKP